MQEFNDELGTTGQGTAIIIGDRDETRLSNMVTLAEGADNEDVTTFQPEGNAKEYAYLLTSGTVSVKGFLSQSAEVVKAQLAQVLGKSRTKPLVIVGKYGLAPGTEANFARALSNTHNASHSLTGVTSADATLALTGTGIVDGVSLHRVFGDTTPGQSEVQKLTFNNADPNVFRGVRANGTTQVFSFGLGIDNAALSAGIAGLPAYTGRTITVTGAALTGATNKSGARQIAYDGAINVPQLEAVSGAVDSFLVNGGNSGNYSVNGGATFTLPITEGALQTNARNLGGQFAGVVVKGSSVGNTAAGEIHTVSGTGNALTVYGVDVFSKTTATLQTAIRALDAAHSTAVVAGTITQAASGSYTTNDAGDTSYRGTYTATGYNFNGYPVYQTGTGTGARYLVYGGSNYWQMTAVTPGANSGGSVISPAYNNPNAGSTATPPLTGWQNGGSPIPAPTFTSGGTPASANLTINYDASAGNIADLVFVGTGYTGASTQPGANGSANFKLYYPVSATPGAPTKTGAGAIITRVPVGLSPDVAASTIQRSTGLDVNFSYNFVNASDAGEWIDYQIESTGGFHLAASVLEANGVGASLQIIVETADADGAGAPVPASIVTLHEFAPFTERGYSMISEDTPVKRLIRVRYVVTGGGEYVFAVALAPR